LLRPEETITWVAGPRRNPSWERYITHPGLFLLALLLGAAGIFAGRLITGSWSGTPKVALYSTAAGLVYVTILVLGLSNAYFTRLVVTNFRLVIMQGYEVCRSWRIDDLPPSLVRYRKEEEGEGPPTIDLDSMKTMLGGSSSQFVEAKTILAFGKQLGQIKARDNGKP
jgi:hypothetical protein